MKHGKVYPFWLRVVEMVMKCFEILRVSTTSSASLRFRLPLQPVLVLTIRS